MDINQGQAFTRTFTLTANQPQPLPPANDYLILSATSDQDAVLISRSDNDADFSSFPYGVTLRYPEMLKRRIRSTVTQVVVVLMTTGGAQLGDNRQGKTSKSKDFATVAGVATGTTDVLIVPAAANPRGVVVRSTSYVWTNPTVGNVMQADIGTTLFEHTFNSIYENSAAGGPGATVIRQTLFNSEVEFPAGLDMYLKIQIPTAGAFRLSYALNYRANP